MKNTSSCYRRASFAAAWFFLLLPCFFLHAQDRSASFDSLLNQYRQLNWSGVLLVGNTEGIRYSRAFGYADREKKRPMEPNTLFKTESVGKMFTAVRILQLVADGRLSLTSTVAELLPDWNIPNATKIRIEHLLTHTSGLSSQWDHPAWVFGKIYSNAELKKFVEEAPVIFSTPGEKSYYSNSGYVLMEEMISKLDKRPFEESIQQHIFSPAGMKFTRSLGDSVLPHNAALPYYQVTGNRFAPDNTRYGDGKATGAGGWMSTAGDLYLFAKAWLTGKLLPRQWMDIQLTNNHSVDSSSASLRFGMAVLRNKPPQTFIAGHNGGGRGFTTDVYFDLYKGDIVIWCSNLYGTAYQLTGRVFDILNNRAYTAPAHAEGLRLADWLLQQPQEKIPPVTDTVLSRLGISKAGEFLFFTVFDNLTELAEHRSAAAAIAAGRERFPQSVYSWIKSGENALKQNQPGQAKKYFEQALGLAEEKNDKELITLIRQKISSLKE